MRWSLQSYTQGTNVSNPISRAGVQEGVGGRDKTGKEEDPMWRTREYARQWSAYW